MTRFIPRFVSDLAAGSREKRGRHARRKRRPARHDSLFETLENRRVLSVNVTFHGDALSGAVLQHVQVETVFVGSQWQSNQDLVNDAVTLNNYFNFLTDSPYMDLMSEYYEVRGLGIGNVYVGRGSWTGGDVWGSNPPASENDAQIQAILWSAITAGAVPYPNDWESLYFIFLPPGVASAECQANHWGAYHSAFEKVVGQNEGANVISHVTYAVVPWPGSYSEGTANALQWQEIYSSHELAEAVTNPGNAIGGFTNLGGAWYANGNQFADGQGREIADLAAPPNLKFGYYDGYWVQALWSNEYTDPNMPGDHRILPPGTTHVFSEGNGQGVFPPGNAGVGFDEDLDPLAGHLPTASPPTYEFSERFTSADPAEEVSAMQGLFATASDPNSLPLSVELLTAPSSGFISLYPDGSFFYSPNPGFIGNDSFTIELRDGEFQSNPITVDLTVNSPPPLKIATGLTMDATEGTRFTQVLGIFTDPNGAGALSNYSARIDWGDGTSASAGTISGPYANGDFFVTGSHDYADESPGEQASLVVDREGSVPSTFRYYLHGG